MKRIPSITVRRDPKGNARKTIKHRDRTKYRRKNKHVHPNTSGSS